MAGTNSGTRTAGYIVAVVLVVAGLAAWGVAMLRGGGSDGPVAATYSTSVQGAVVVAGKPAANTVDIYEDMLCPICARFESNYNAEITKAINEGKIQARYHPVAILNRATNPPGYSLRAANATICAAEVGVFAAYHEKLFTEQPREGSAGLTDQELIAKGQEVGAPPSFAQCVSSGKYNRAITEETMRAARDTSLRREGASAFGTPTVTVNGKRVEVSDDSWLTDITQ